MKKNEIALITGVTGVEQRSHFLGGEQVIVTFDNGYGASIIRTGLSYGTELGVVHGDRAKNAPLCYATPVTSDVIGHIASQDELRGILEQIASLPRNDTCNHGRDY